MERLKAIFADYKELFVYTVIAVFLGALIGVVEAVFGHGLALVTEWRTAHLMIFLPFLALAGIVIVFCYTRFGGKAAGGMNLVFAAGRGEEDEIPLRLVPFIMISTWMTHLFGGSAGREGVAVQIGAAVSHWCSKHLPLQLSARVFVIIGMAAGFGGLFEAPFAATLFAVEVLVAGKVEYRAILPAFAAAFTASTVAGACGLEKFTVALNANVDMTALVFIKLVGLGLIFALVGAFFACTMRWAKKIVASRIPNPYVRVFVVGVCLSVLLFVLHRGRYSGLGVNLITNCFGGGEIYVYDWILKIALTVITLSVGFQGGELTPIFAIGASLGVILAPVFGLPVMLVAALGYAALFASATNTVFSPIFIGAEIFGFEYVPYFFIVCAVAYIFNMNKSIYSQQEIISLDMKRFV